MASNYGTKVTTDPASVQDPKNENPGIVTSDSLAAESIQSGGSFGANAEARGPMEQPSYSSTANTTDTSSARVLEPARDAEARQASEEWNEAAQLNAGRKLTATGGDDDLSSSLAQQQKPKGENLREGGFDSGAPNASFNPDVGGRKDPGREALRQFEQDNVPVAGGAGPRQGRVTDDGQYDVLDETSA